MNWPMVFGYLHIYPWEGHFWLDSTKLLGTVLFYTPWLQLFRKAEVKVNALPSIEYHLSPSEYSQARIEFMTTKDWHDSHEHARLELDEEQPCSTTW